jgi:FkbM family methyltransferase
VAFEPDPFNYWLLDRNMTLNKIDKAIVVSSAIGAERGIVRMYRYRSTNYGRHNLITDYGYGSRMVPISDLDSSLDALGLSDRPVLVLKIDVEGYEPAVIAGADRTLERTGAVVLEFSPSLGQKAGLAANEMVDRLHNAGFLPYRFVDGTKVGQISLSELKQTVGQMDAIWLKAKAAERLNS